MHTIGLIYYVSAGEYTSARHHIGITIDLHIHLDARTSRAPGDWPERTTALAQAVERLVDSAGRDDGTDVLRGLLATEEWCDAPPATLRSGAQD